MLWKLLKANQGWAKAYVDYWETTWNNEISPTKRLTQGTEKLCIVYMNGMLKIQNIEEVSEINGNQFANILL